MKKYINRFIAFLLGRFTDFEVTAWGATGRIMAIGTSCHGNQDHFFEYPDYVRLDFNLNPNETLQSQLRKM